MAFWTILWLNLSKFDQIAQHLDLWIQIQLLEFEGEPNFDHVQIEIVFLIQSFSNFSHSNWELVRD